MGLWSRRRSAGSRRSTTGASDFRATCEAMDAIDLEVTCDHGTPPVTTGHPGHLGPRALRSESWSPRSIGRLNEQTAADETATRTHRARAPPHGHPQAILCQGH